MCQVGYCLKTFLTRSSYADNYTSQWHDLPRYVYTGDQVMEYITPHYQEVLDTLAETLRAERRQQFLAQLAIPLPRSSADSTIQALPGNYPQPVAYTV